MPHHPKTDQNLPSLKKKEPGVISYHFLKRTVNVFAWKDTIGKLEKNIQTLEHREFEIFGK